MLSFKKDTVTQLWYPSQYEDTDYTLPDDIRDDWNKLNSLIEQKYMREYLKICAYYNKIFPSLRSYDWSFSSYNALPFTVYDQERDDTGTGISANYLKSVIDTVVARISNLTFDVSLSSPEPELVLELYKNQAERFIRQKFQKYRMEHLVTECFHDAAILGFSHIFADPWTKELRKLSDWEIGLFEPEFNQGALRKLLVRDFAFPTSKLAPYINNCTKEQLEKWSKKTHVDIKLYMDCTAQTACATIDTETLDPIKYPFDEVQLCTLCWDIGTKKTTIASLFDMLFPLQREMSKLMAKQTQLLTNYKGPVPVFSTQDADAVLKAINNSSGEALFIDSRSTSEFMTVINPMPLDPAINAEIEGLKSRMFEIAGVQEISMDMENYRSAAAVIALDQMRDAKYQSQLFLMAEFVKSCVKMLMTFEAFMQNDNMIEWDKMLELVEKASVDVVVNHNNDPGNKKEEAAPDYQILAMDRFVLMCTGVLLRLKT